MTSLGHDVQALLTLMDRQYREIREIEVEHRIFGAEGDYRPRIEHFQDAVRVLSSGETDLYSEGSRLSVERLAYDVAILRQINAKPLLAGRGEQHLSPVTGLASPTDAAQEARPDRQTRNALAELYKDYTVLFVAVFAEKAEMNASARIEELNALVEDCVELQDMLQKVAAGAMSLEELFAQVNHLEHDQLRRAILQILRRRKVQATELRSAIDTIGQAMGQFDQQIAQIDDAGMRYSGAQLAIYEDAKGTVQRLAAQGLNVAGKFVENAMHRAQASGRGR